jgi:hypothetical protein
VKSIIVHRMAITGQSTDRRYFWKCAHGGCARERRTQKDEAKDEPDGRAGRRRNWFSPRPTPVSLGILLLLADPKQHRMKNRARARTPSISHDPTGIVVVDKTIAKSTRPSTIQLLHLKQNGSPLRFLHDNLFP